MAKARFTRAAQASLLLAFLALTGPAAGQATPEASRARVETALQNITRLLRPDETGYATVWDGNKYIQCGYRPERGFRCEAAGTLMQPSLERVLVPERVSRLLALGWQLDPSFGNYVQTFPPDAAPSLVAEEVLRALAEAYDAKLSALEAGTRWIATEPCPPRNGPTQNLAGMVNDAPSMRATAVHACAYVPAPKIRSARAVDSAQGLIRRYGQRATGEIQRLRVNMERNVFVVLEAEIGYVQCRPETPPPAIYCEAQSPDSWPALAAVLTPDRLARLHAAGFADPGRGPNFWKVYPADTFDDAVIAGELLTILHEVYGYAGTTELKVKTE